MNGDGGWGYHSYSGLPSLGPTSGQARGETAPHDVLGRSRRPIGMLRFFSLRVLVVTGSCCFFIFNPSRRPKVLECSKLPTGLPPHRGEFFFFCFTLSTSTVGRCVQYLPLVLCLPSVEVYCRSCVRGQYCVAHTIIRVGISRFVRFRPVPSSSVRFGSARFGSVEFRLTTTLRVVPVLSPCPDRFVAFWSFSGDVEGKPKEGFPGPERLLRVHGEAKGLLTCCNHQQCTIRSGTCSFCADADADATGFLTCRLCTDPIDKCYVCGAISCCSFAGVLLPHWCGCLTLLGL